MSEFKVFAVLFKSLPRVSSSGLFEQALTSGFTQGSEYLSLWTTFIDYLRRRIKWDAGKKLVLGIETLPLAFYVLSIYFLLNVCLYVTRKISYSIMDRFYKTK